VFVAVIAMATWITRGAGSAVYVAAVVRERPGSSAAATDGARAGASAAATATRAATTTRAATPNVP
jgi:hypothetical protein